MGGLFLPASDPGPPLLTFPFLDYISGMSMADWTVLEFGGGHSSCWWAARAKHVITYETSETYMLRLQEMTKSQKNIELLLLSNTSQVGPAAVLADIIIIDIA